MIDTHQLTPGHPVCLDEVTTSGRQLHPDRTVAEREFKELRKELVRLQYRWYAEGKRKLLIVFQALDAGGKDGTIRKLLAGVNPQGVRVTSFKKPSARELDHDFLWRVHQAVPGKGMIGVFNRSHYEDVLVVRVDQIVPESVWRPRFEMINAFEKMLTDTGTTILKFFLHISREEQRKRFQDRLDDAEKHWKFSHEDLEKRKQWNDYTPAFEEMLERCTTEHAPWHVIPADQKWYRNLAVARAVVGTLRKLNPQYPPEPEGLDQVVIPAN